MAKRLSGRAFYLKMKRAKELKAAGKSSRRKTKRSNRFKKKSTGPSRSKILQAAKDRMDFQGTDKANLHKQTIELPGKNDILRRVGKCPELVYLSDKRDGRMKGYRHKLKKHGNMDVLVSKDGRVHTVIISGVDMKLTKRGLVG